METCLNAPHVSLESFLVSGPIPETDHGKNNWPHSIGNAQTIQNCCPYVFIFFAAYILRTRSSVLQIQSLPVSDCSSSRVQKFGPSYDRGMGFFQFRVTKSLLTPHWIATTGQQNHHVPQKKCHGISRLNPHELPIWLLVISPCSTRKKPMEFPDIFCNFLTKKPQTSDSVKRRFLAC